MDDMINNLFNMDYLNSMYPIFRDLSNKQLESVPTEIYDLVDLQILCLNDNKLKKLPMEIGNLINLKNLHLQNNKLETLPAEIGKLINLEMILLHNNELKTLPMEIGNLIRLKSLYLADNKLEKMPEEILNIKNKLFIGESSYNIDNLNHDMKIIIFSELNISLKKLPIKLKEIWLNKSIENYDIKIPHGCVIRKF